MNALRRRLWRLGLIALVLGLSLSGGSPAAAFGYPQDSGFKVVILRPGPGETYYAGPDSPRTAVYVLGRVSGGEFAPEQIEILLTILEDGRPSGEAHASATAGGDFNFLIATNPDGPEEVGRSSGNCYPCHGPVSLAFPGRRSLLRVTATDPLGRSATAERWITIERPRLADVTVRARLAGGSELAPPGLPISATTNLLGWRGRQFSSPTGDRGVAVLRLEALDTQATRYRLAVPPAVVDGVLYQTAAPVELVLPPDWATAGPIELVVNAALGRIDGGVDGNCSRAGELLTLRAVDLRSGRSFTTTSANRTFGFAGLPLSRYLVTADPAQVARLGCRAETALVDLADATESRANLTLEPAPGPLVAGAVRDPAGEPVPFVWLQTAGGRMAPAATGPSGSFAWSAPSGAFQALRIGAPGYWSRLLPAGRGFPLRIGLRPQPGTRSLPWGDGKITLPASSLATADDAHVVLQRGWLWGHGSGRFTVEMPEARLHLANGRFALEYLPGEGAWLYQLEGEGELELTNGELARVGAGEMIRFAGTGPDRPRPVPLDETAAMALQELRRVPFALETEPGLYPRLTGIAARAGILLPAAVDVGWLAPGIALGGVALSLALLRARRRSGTHRTAR